MWKNQHKKFVVKKEKNGGEEKGELYEIRIRFIIE